MKQRYLSIILLTTSALSACGGGDTAGPAAPAVAGAIFAAEDTVAVTQAIKDKRPVAVTIEYEAGTEGAGDVWVKGVFNAAATTEIKLLGARNVDHSMLIEFAAPPQSGIGMFDDTLQISLCADSLCSATMGDSSDSVAVSMDVYAIPAWTTHQGNASHTGYVPIWVDVDAITNGWTWVRPPSTEPVKGINPVTTENGVVYISDDVYFGDATLHAVDVTDGGVVWDSVAVLSAAFNGPAIGTNHIFAARKIVNTSSSGTSASGTSRVVAFSKADGTESFIGALQGQWPQWFPPTIFEGVVYQGSGTYGGYLKSFAETTGAEGFTVDVGGAWDHYAVAADSDGIYHHTADRMVKLDASGNIVSSVNDPNGSSGTTGKFSAPVILDANLVGSYSDDSFSGRASGNVEHFDQRNFTVFDMDSETLLWTTSRTYLTHPALRDGVIYLAGNAPATLDALDADTGNILWSWTMPAEWADSEFHRNMLVTDNVLFFSTNKQTVGIDLASHEVVFTSPKPGMLALGDDRMLFIAPGYRESNGTLEAYKGL